MSVSKWAYVPKYCDGNFCVGDCDLCDEWQKFEDTDEESEVEECTNVSIVATKE